MAVYIVDSIEVTYTLEDFSHTVADEVALEEDDTHFDTGRINLTLQFKGT